MLQFKTLINRLNIAQRFWASICFFSLPMGVLFYFNIDQISEKIGFARQELAGNRIQRPAVRLIKTLGEFRTASVTQQGSADIGAAKQEVDAQFHQLEEANRDAGLPNLEITEIESKWDSLQRASSVSSKAASDQYDQLIGDMSDLINQAGDASNLTLDPEMDSYHLADVTSGTAAQTLMRIASARATIEPQLKSRNLTASTLTAVAIYRAMLKESDFDRIAADVKVALKENARNPRGPSPTLRASLEPALAQYQTDVESFINLLAAFGQGKLVSREKFQQVAARASQSSFDLWEKTLAELDGLLEMRIDGFAKYRLKFLVGASTCLLFPLIIMFFAVRGVIIPLTVAVAHVDCVAGGDLSKELPASYLARKDEIGTLARAMQQMSASLREVIKNITGGVHVMSSSSAELSANSAQMSDGAREASGKAHAVAASAEQMTANVMSVAAGMEQATSNLSSIATATEQMTATIGEIAGNSEKARRITDEATRQAARIIEQMNHLGTAAQEIGRVTEAITEISSQTNLLALNATIEAARAGSAGKGFAVVANEIKELAQQTAAATEDIKARISGVQSSTAGGIAEIGKVSQVIHDVSDIVSSIAAAIEEQSTVTRDIARNIAEASTGVGDASQRVAEASQATVEIAQDIVVVDQAAGHMADGSEQVKASATELSRVAEQLQTTVQRFKV